MTKKNIFQEFGVTHLSASQITTFAADPSFWFATRVLGMKQPASAAMERGKAVETAVASHLTGSDLVDAIEIGLSQFDAANRFGRLGGDSEKERAGIEGMVTQAVEILKAYGVPDFPEEGQHKIEVPIRFGDEPEDTIPIIGFLDFVYEDRIIDLKTTFAVPSAMKWNHRCQAAIYQRATGNKIVEFLYVSPKKAAMLRPQDVSQDQAQIREIVRRMARFLSLGDLETLRNAVPIVMDGWTWKGLEAERERFYGV